jgi:hypothetical protein
VGGPAERALFVPHHTEFVHLLCHVDSFHFEADENKAELARFWVHVLQDSPDAIKLVAENDKLTTRLMDYFISMRPRQYNKASLPAFYQVLLMFCDYESFLAKLTMHHNFEWAIKSLYLDTNEYLLVSEVLLQNIRRCIPNQEFRTRYIATVSQYDKYYSNAENILRLLDLLLLNTEDSINFCVSNNLELLSRFIIQQQERNLENEESYSNVGMALDILTRATCWLLVPLDASNGRAQEALEISTESWNHKQTLLSALLSYMDHLPFSSNQHLASLCHRLIDIMCGTDSVCQVLVLRYLHEQFASRDAMQTSRFASHHHTVATDETHTSPEAMYYSFVARFGLAALSRGESSQVPSAIDLAILIAKEILLLPTPTAAVLMPVVPMLKTIWEHAEYGQILRENRRLDVYP